MKSKYRYGLWRWISDSLTAPFHSKSTRLVRRLRRAGVKVGEGVIFRDPDSATIDLTRPSLIEIGDYVDMNVNFTIMTHDFATGVFLHKYGEFVNSSGRVRLGNNIYFGRDVTILKGVTVGDNCVIGLGSVVTHDIPADSVAVGIPARVVCTLDEYFERCKSRSLEEAFGYARSIREQWGRNPRPSDFWEEFPFFLSGEELRCPPGNIPVRRQLQEQYDHYVRTHKAPFRSFEEFLKAAFAEKK